MFSTETIVSTAIGIVAGGILNILVGYWYFRWSDKGARQLAGFLSRLITDSDTSPHIDPKTGELRGLYVTKRLSATAISSSDAFGDIEVTRSKDQAEDHR